MNSNIKENAVLYISRLPYGFDDKAAKGFFEQFDNIKGVCMPRSRKTGWTKGYMFVLFENKKIAKEV